MKYKVTLNQTVYEVEVERGEATLLAEYEAATATAPAVAAAPAPAAPAAAPAPAPAAAAAPVAAGEVVSSPMPGTVLRIPVKEGDAVKMGTVLVVVEAMKMENEIMAPRDATVKQIAVSQGATVDTGTPLIVLG